MSDPRLLTIHGQILVFDLKNSCIVASRDLKSEHALRISIIESRAYLYFLQYGIKKYILVDGYSALLSDGLPNASDRFEVRLRDNGFVYIGKNGFFLSVTPTGDVNFQVWMEVYEKLWLLHDDSSIDLLLNNSWVSSSLRRLVKADEIDFKSNFVLSIGGVDYRFEDIVRHGHVQDGRKIHLLYDKFKIERLTLFRPLVYFCAYGGENSFKLLSMCVSSIEKYGNYDGDYMILTDKDRNFIDKYLNFVDSKRLHVEFVPAIDVIDMVCARFKIFDLPRIEAYQPVLYSDFDIICNASLEEMLLDITTKHNIYVKAEGEISLNHYGSVLLEADNHAKTVNHLGFNSGVIGFYHLSEVELNFRSVISCIYSQIAEGVSRDATEVYDQPAANYVYNKVSNYDLDLMQRHVHPWPPAANEEISGRGLVHFCGGVGANHKLERITSYYAFLEKAAAN